MKHRLTTQRGFTLPATIFILVILASISAFLLTISSVSHTASSLALQGARAYYAAYSGLEWATYQATNPAEHDSICSVGGTTTPFTIVSPAGTGLAGGFKVDVKCEDDTTSYSEGANPAYFLDKITVKAYTLGASPGDPDFATRTLTATVSKGAPL